MAPSVDDINIALEKIFHDVVFVDNSDPTNNLKNRTYYLYDPAGNNWLLDNKKISMVTESHFNLIMNMYTNYENIPQERMDRNLATLFYVLWDTSINKSIFLSTNNKRFTYLNRDLKDIDVLTKDASKEYIKQRNNQSEIILAQ